MPKIMIAMSREELNQLQYPVVVERLNKGFYGKFARAFDREFGNNQRQRARYWYRKFYRWYLVKGTPEYYVFSPGTLEWIKKLIRFCGES